MARYIDADKLLHRLPNDLPYKASVKRALIQAPTADVVEVVRCEKCRAFDEYHYPVEDFDGRCILDGIERDKDFYCGYGKRK